jgi:hypothetical protein
MCWFAIGRPLRLRRQRGSAASSLTCPLPLAPAPRGATMSVLSSLHASSAADEPAASRSHQGARGVRRYRPLRPGRVQGKGPGTVGEQPQESAHDRQVLQHCNHLLLTLGRVAWYRGAASLEAICLTLGWDRHGLAGLTNMAPAWGTRSLRHPSGTMASPPAVEPRCWTDRMQVLCQCSTRPGACPPWWATSPPASAAPCDVLCGGRRRGPHRQTVPTWRQCRHTGMAEGAHGRVTPPAGLSGPARTRGPHCWHGNCYVAVPRCNGLGWATVGVTAPTVQAPTGAHPTSARERTRAGHPSSTGAGAVRRDRVIGVAGLGTAAALPVIPGAEATAALSPSANRPCRRRSHEHDHDDRRHAD